MCFMPPPAYCASCLRFPSAAPAVKSPFSFSGCQSAAAPRHLFGDDALAITERRSLVAGFRLFGGFPSGFTAAALSRFSSLGALAAGGKRLFRRRSPAL